MLERPDDFQDITHVVLDEVHERTIDSDFLLVVLRRLMQKRTDLKLILMSATVDAQRFSNYLGGVPVLNIPGRTFPVEMKYLEDAVEMTNYRLSEEDSNTLIEDDLDEISDTTGDNTGGLQASLDGYSKQTKETILKFDEYRMDYQLIKRLLLNIATAPEMDHYSKAILVFMPGLAEIRRLNDEILSEPTFQRGWIVHALHSSIASEDQEKAFIVPPEGFRKIVIATNIAETGITIPDITAVIDTGKEKMMRFDERRQLSRLVESFISRANAKQRRGRAGRVQNGICFHLFTKHRHEKLLAEQQTPEMLRLSLQDLVLRVKICKLGEVEQTLTEALDPPSSKNIRRAIDSLKEVKALTSNESLTPLGSQLAKLPLDVFLGKLIIHGAFFKCLDAAVSIAAILSSKSPFVNTMGSNSQRDAARNSFQRGNYEPFVLISLVILTNS
jgi:ATP-dependent RNA helicase DHX29